MREIYAFTKAAGVIVEQNKEQKKITLKYYKKKMPIMPDKKPNPEAASDI